MKKSFLLLALFVFNSLLLTLKSYAEEQKRDTVTVGIYITSIHDIDFKQKEYTINLWLWLKYNNKDFDFVHNLEVPQAKTVTKSFSTLDSSGGRYYLLLKLLCVMKDSWKIANFPFDRQKLRMSIENSQFDTRNLIFKADTLGKHYDPRFTLSGWNIDSFDVSVGTKAYETAFGDTTLDKPHSEYSAFKVKVGITRNATDLFWKMFLGMYIAFLITYVCFYIHPESIESRFGLTVGALFASIGNKYIIDSALPETTSFTLVDALHGINLFFILIAITSCIYSLNLIKDKKIKQARRFDFIIAQVLLVTYAILNFYFISRAHGG